MQETGIENPKAMLSWVEKGNTNVHHYETMMDAAPAALLWSKHGYFMNSPST
jgi:hypothetical protein